jgi:hypothetical protein
MCIFLLRRSVLFSFNLLRDFDTLICSILNELFCNGNFFQILGHSGGGLYAFDKKLKKFILVGITSYGDGCARVGLPGLIFNKIFLYYKIIICF